MNFKVLLVTAFAAFAAAGPLGVDPTSESGELTARQCCISKNQWHLQIKNFLVSSILENVPLCSDIEM
ncbi:hypothetical protein CGGC5_v005777 [Colletotrichum fructicola Nara gc5]|uniref:Uncharacterized protein n=1 Tax=Colletotrichum fructicola (strain Nara gc5) TaxID=1213859 RepID=A0A7J6JCA8_COLFN|nr:hypothetical protein CGGC5_v005777 [Colletotrichum fructicola Nara gc5]